MGARAGRGAAGGRRAGRERGLVDRTGAARRDALLGWYRASRRDLPWRRTRDPYAIWLSETMLQQTRVETVIPYYERFLTRFPDVQALAGAELGDVLSEWAGLGYYSRARHLKQAAEQIVDRFGGRVPGDPDALRSLPGVGRYTAGAVASIAFDRPAPVVDGNVARVLARACGIRAPIEATATRARLWEEAERLVRGPAPGDLNQALMELGARVCVPRAPRCPECPIAGHCDAHARGDAAELPLRSPRRVPRRIAAVAGLVLRRGRVLAVRRPAGGLLGGLWELPGGSVERGTADARTLAAALRARTGLCVRDVSELGRVEHAFTHRRLELRVFRCRAEPGRVRLDGLEAHRWIRPEAFAALAVASVTRRALALGAAGA